MSEFFYEHDTYKRFASSRAQIYDSLPFLRPLKKLHLVRPSGKISYDFSTCFAFGSLFHGVTY